MRKIAVLLSVLAFGLNTGAQTVTYQGQLKVGKTDSVIIYLSEETDELWGFCFRNKSTRGRAILAKCRNGQRNVNLPEKLTVGKIARLKKASTVKPE